MDQAYPGARPRGAGRRWVNLPLLALVRAYQAALGPMMGGHCRFAPSCSEYAAEALRLHSMGRALRLIARRIGRCHPWGGGGFDPVPLPPLNNERSSAETQATGRP